MGNDIIAYIQKLELFGFFSGYCLIYTILFSLKSSSNSKVQTLLQKLIDLLPYAYALTASLYLGMVVKNISPGFSVRNLNAQFRLPYLQVIGLSGVFFWIPYFGKKPILSLIHSLVFFFFLLRDVFIQLKLSQGTEIIHNNMKVFTDSLLLNLITLVFISGCYFFLHHFFTSRNGTS